MKNKRKSVLGITLLEILLVLAVIATIIVMSVRYYEAATASQEANSTLAQLQAIVAMADSLAQPTGSYQQVTADTLTSLLPAPGLRTPWGTAVDIVPSAQNIEITLNNTPSNVCPLIVTKIAADTRFHFAKNACGPRGTVVNLKITYGFSSN